MAESQYFRTEANSESANNRQVTVSLRLLRLIVEYLDDEFTVDEVKEQFNWRKFMGKRSSNERLSLYGKSHLLCLCRLGLLEQKSASSFLVTPKGYAYVISSEVLP